MRNKSLKSLSTVNNKLAHKKDGVIAKLIKKHNITVSVSDWVIDEDGDALRVKAFKRDKIVLEYWGFRYTEDKEAQWCEDTCDYNLFNKKYIKIDKSIEDLEKEVLDSVKDVESLDPSKTESEINESKAISAGVTKEFLISVREGLENRRKKFEIMERILNGKRNALSSYVRNMEKQIEKVEKVITVIELYLGIQEEIVQIRDGLPAGLDVPIVFRQQILYMDEEVGDPKDKGLDFRKIGEFDEWVKKTDNLNKMLPEERGVVVIKPRRSDKDYGNWFLNAVYNAKNKQTYILIRNGERIYRIYSENLQVRDRLFPTKDEFEKQVLQRDIGYFNKEEIKERKFDYGKNALMMQGLIDRTDVFYPHKEGLNIFNFNTYKNGEIKFIHDDEIALPPERKYWRDWQKEINSTLKRGSRVYVTHKSGDSVKYYVDYVYERTASWPSSGVYVVTDVSVAEKNMYDRKNKGETYVSFVYNSKDTVWPGWSDYRREAHERKRGITFFCDIRSDFILNYDRISLDDVEYYINSRVDRGNYLSMIPILWEIKKERLEEIEWEKHFVKLVSDRTGVQQEEVWKAVNWWKYKNIWKRPICKDDAKALRMIERKVRNPKLWS